MITRKLLIITKSELLLTSLVSRYHEIMLLNLFSNSGNSTLPHKGPTEGYRFGFQGLDTSALGFWHSFNSESESQSCSFSMQLPYFLLAPEPPVMNRKRLYSNYFNLV